MKTRILAAAAALIAAGAAAQTTQKLSAGKANDYGLVYNLPRTAVTVTAEVCKTVKTPGEFALYSKKYLDIDPILEPSARWSLENVVLSTTGIANQAESYQVEFKSGSTPFIIVDANTSPLAINTEAEAMPAVELPQPQEARPTILQTEAAAQAMTQEMLQSKSLAKRAQLAAARIFELRQSRSDIISGNADQMPGDGEAMKLVLDNLQRQEEALTAMFAGTVQKSTVVRTYTVIPDGSERTVTAGRISVTDGPVDSDDLSGIPLNVATTVLSRGQLPRNEKGEPKRLPKGGLAYCLPGQAEFTVEFKGETVAQLTAEIAQLGVVFALEPNLFSDKKAPAYAIFDPYTGAIRELGTLREER